MKVFMGMVVGYWLVVAVTEKKRSTAINKTLNDIIGARS